MQRVKGVTKEEEEQKDRGHTNARHNMTPGLVTGRIQRSNYGGHNPFGEIVLLLGTAKP